MRFFNAQNGTVLQADVLCVLYVQKWFCYLLCVYNLFVYRHRQPDAPKGCVLKLVSFPGF